MGQYLNRARSHFGRDASGLLEGGRYSLVHTRSLEFDDLRPYVPGDDVRDIDWKATARSGHVLIKRFVTEKHHKILVVADTGRNGSATTPSGELKRDVAANVIGALGLITLQRSDEIGMVLGDARGSLDIRLRRGETHVEYLLHRFHDRASTRRGPSDIRTQLEWVTTHYRRSMLVFIVSDEPDPGPRLTELLVRLTARHDVMWAMVADMAVVGSAGDECDGFDVSNGRFVLGGGSLGPTVVTAYRRAESERRERLSDLMTRHGVPHAIIDGSAGIRAAMVEMTGVFARAR